ncbi:DsbA family protein [Paenibacillus agri]|nr:DsbA family protein [Paenibacillus agri]
MAENNKMISCDLETGLCSEHEDGQDYEMVKVELAPVRKFRVIYYTDPICSACWALEPYIRKLEEEYAPLLTIEYRMGGLLPGWEHFSDGGNGISKPSDVAHHWEEIAEQSGMSMDGDVWLEDPLHSSYPPSIAFKAAQLQGKEQADAYLRRLREMVFLEKVNIAKEEALIQASIDVGLDTERFKRSYHDPATAELFYQEIEEGAELGVRGFPTILIVDEEGQGARVSGYRPYQHYVEALNKVAKDALQPNQKVYTAKQLLQKYNFLGTEEIRIMLDGSREETLAELQRLEQAGLVECVPVKFGFFWRNVN